MNDTTLIAAVAVGFISFISPCVLPMVPGYLSAVSGVTVTDLEKSNREVALKVLGPALIFCLTFTAMFVALGATATGFGSLLQDNRGLLNKIAGVVIIAMGVFFLAAPFVDRLNRDWHPQALIKRAGSGGPLLAGIAFAFAWTPCVGPTLAAILAAASTQNTAGEGMLLLGAYSAGLAIPFLISAVAFVSAIKTFGWFTRHYLILTAIAGAILIAMGILIYTDELFRLNIEAQKLLDSLGLNIFQDL